MKFSVGQKVKLLDKTCGPIKGLRNVLNANYKDKDWLVPKYGVIDGCEEHHYKYGFFYRVTPDNYDSKIFRHKNLMFYEDDLLEMDWIEDELFVI